MDLLQQALQAQQMNRSEEQPPHAVAAVAEAITSQRKALQEEMRAVKRLKHAGQGYRPCGSSTAPWHNAQNVRTPRYLAKPMASRTGPSKCCGDQTALSPPNPQRSQHALPTGGGHFRACKALRSR